jgi:hypothetical protein
MRPRGGVKSYRFNDVPGPLAGSARPLAFLGGGESDVGGDSEDVHTSKREQDVVVRGMEPGE